MSESTIFYKLILEIIGTRLKDYCPICKVPYDLEHLNGLFLKVRKAAYEIIKRKGRTHYAIALGLTKIVESILLDQNAILTVSCLLHDCYGVSDICLSVPAIVNRSGIRETIKLPLDEKEIKKKTFESQ